MSRILFMCLDATLAGIALIPLYFILDKQYFHSKRKMICYLLFSLYLSGVYAVVGLPTVSYVRLDFHYNLIPFAYMFSDYMNSLLNVVLFVPLGFFLPVCWKVYGRLWKTALFGFCISLLIELLQIFTYRATDVNDLITNTLGAVIGWCVARIVLRFSPAINPGWKTAEVHLVFGATFFVMFFIQPFLADMFYSFIW